MKKFHISIAVRDLEESISQYSMKLESQPCVVVQNKYALWRTDTLNFSISQKPEIAGQMRHLGFENENAQEFTEIHDCNGILWEEFTQEMQEAEIENFYGKKIIK